MSTRDFSWVKGGRAYGWRPTTLVVPNVKKIRGLYLHGTPWATSACCGKPLPFYVHTVPPTCFGHTCGQPQGVHYKGYTTKTFWTQSHMYLTFVQWFYPNSQFCSNASEIVRPRLIQNRVMKIVSDHKKSGLPSKRMSSNWPLKLSNRQHTLCKPRSPVPQSRYSQFALTKLDTKLYLEKQTLFLLHTFFENKDVTAHCYVHNRDNSVKITMVEDTGFDFRHRRGFLGSFE